MPEKNYETLGGWLLFIVITQIILIPYSFFSAISRLSSALSVLRSLAAPPAGLSTVLWLTLVVALLSVTIQCVFVVLIFKRNPNFLKCFEIMYLFGIITSLSLMIALNVITSANNSPFGNTSYVVKLLGSLGDFAIWAMYFCNSIRVRVYMGSDAYLRKSIFFKREKDPLASSGGSRP